MTLTFAECKKLLCVNDAGEVTVQSRSKSFELARKCRRKLRLDPWLPPRLLVDVRIPVSTYKIAYFAFLVFTYFVITSYKSYRIIYKSQTL